MANALPTCTIALAHRFCNSAQHFCFDPIHQGCNLLGRFWGFTEIGSPNRNEGRKLVVGVLMISEIWFQRSQSFPPATENGLQRATPQRAGMLARASRPGAYSRPGTKRHKTRGVASRWGRGLCLGAEPRDSRLGWDTRAWSPEGRGLGILGFKRAGVRGRDLKPLQALCMGHACQSAQLLGILQGLSPRVVASLYKVH